MKISNEYPPNIEDIRKVLKLHEGIVFTYGDTLYNPSGAHIGTDLMRHEETHTVQQEKIGVKDWWKKYLSDSAFRVSQETEAYRNQYDAAKKMIRDKNALYLFRRQIATWLSGEMYGNSITFNDAFDSIY